MTVSHIESNPDPTQCYNAVEKFCEGKTVYLKHYNTTPVMLGILPNGQPSISVFTTCLIHWEATEEEYKSYLFRMKTLITK